MLKVTVALTQCNISSGFFSVQSADLLYSQTAIYAQGVGLGASKAKEMGKYAEGYSGYVHMAQDAVSAIGLQGTKMTTSCRKFLLFCRNAGSGALWELGATRIIGIATTPPLIFWFISCFRLLRRFRSGNYIYHPTTFQYARLQVRYYTTLYVTKLETPLSEPGIGPARCVLRSVPSWLSAPLPLLAELPRSTQEVSEKPPRSSVGEKPSQGLADM